MHTIYTFDIKYNPQTHNVVHFWF